jgi:nitrate reductase gamma subunit
MPGAITLFPAPKPGSAMFWNVLKESFLFLGLFKGSKGFWAMAWFFHLALALIVVGHLRVFTGFFDGIFMSLGMTEQGISKMSATSGGAAGVIIMAAAILLILRRLSINRVREISNPADYMALLLVLAILLTGNAMRFGAHFELTQTHMYFSQLFAFSLAASAIPASGMFQVHFLLVQLMLIYIPFSKILHFGGIFFTQTLIQKS